MAAATEASRSGSADPLFQAIFENAAVGIAQVAANGQFLKGNARLQEILGYSEAELRRLDIREITHPDDIGSDLAQMMRILAGEIDSYAMEKRYRRRDGATIWANLSVGCTRGVDGSVDYFVSVVEDITARKAAEAAAAQGVERLRLAFDAGRMASWDWDILNDTVTWSENLASYIGMEAHQFGGTLEDFVRLIHPDDRPMVQSRIADALAGRAEYAVEFRMVCPDGTIRWAGARGQVLRGPDGIPARIVGFDVDITDRKAAELALAETAERYRLASQATRDAIWDWDLDTDAMVWNEALTAAYGHDVAEAGTGAWWIDHVHPDDRDAVLAQTQASAGAHGDHWDLQYRFRRADGSYAVVFDRCFVLRDGTGRITRMVGALQDMTERQRAEEGRQLLLRELDHRVQNLFAIAINMVAITARRSATAGEMAETLTGRLSALANAHALIRNAVCPGQSTLPATDLRRVATDLLTPHMAAESQLVLDGPEVPVGAGAVTAMAMILHELATNAAKYGAASVPTGCIRLEWTQDGGLLHLNWEESGGPPILSPPIREGFGSRLVTAAIEGQLGGRMICDWAMAGMRKRIALPLDRLAS